MGSAGVEERWGGGASRSPGSPDRLPSGTSQPPPAGPRGHSENQLMVVQFTRAGYCGDPVPGRGCEKRLSPFADSASQRRSLPQVHSFPRNPKAPFLCSCVALSRFCSLKLVWVHDLKTASGVRKRPVSPTKYGSWASGVTF